MIDGEQYTAVYLLHGLLVLIHLFMRRYMVIQWLGTGVTAACRRHQSFGPMLMAPVCVANHAPHHENDELAMI